MKTNHLMKMVMLLALVLVANGAWAQASSTSDIFKFKGVIAERVYAPDMPYNTQTHHQNNTFELYQGQSRVLFDVASNKGLQSTGKFTNGDQISKYGNFVIRTSQIPGKQTHYRLKFHYDTNRTRHLDIYRHEEPEWGKLGDKNDGLVVISLQTAALFQSDAEVNSIHKIEIECMNYDNRGFKVEACYFITMMPNFDYSDIDGNDIGNAYIHPSFLIPSNGVNVYPYGEENGTPDHDNYIIEVEEATNYFVDNDPTKQIDWHRTPRNGDANIIDSLTYTNPKLVWSMNYKTPQNMNDVTYCTVDRWGDNASAGHFNGNALWRWIFVHRELFNVASGNVTSTPLKDSDFSKWTNTTATASKVPYEFDYNLNTYSTSIYGKKDVEQRGVGLHTAPYKDYKYLVVKKNVYTWGPKFQFIYNDGGWGLHTVEGTNYGDDFVYVDLDALRTAHGENLWLTSVFADDDKQANVTHVYLAKELKSGWATVNLHKSMYNKQDNYNGTWENSGGDNGTIYGSSSVFGDSYVDLADYNNLDIHVSNGIWPRLLFNRVGNDGNDYIEISEATKDNDNVKPYISDWGNTKRINLEKMLSDKGTVHLNVIKNPNGANIVSMELIDYYAPGLTYITVDGDKVKHLQESDYHMWDGFSDLGVPTFTANTKSTTYQEVMYGSDDKLSYADLAGYDYMEIKVKSGEPLIVFNKQDGEGTIECHPSNDSGKEYYNVINGVYTINLQKIKEDNGYVHLNSIKNWNAGGTTEFDGAVQLQKLSNDQASNYTLNDKDAIHFYTSVYNGDFTNTPYGCHDHATREQINYIYYQTYGNEYNQIMCDAEHVPTNRMPVKDGDNIIGYYANVTADGHLVPANEMKNIKLSIKDICLTKNKVHAQQNHANVAKLFKNHRWGGSYQLISKADVDDDQWHSKQDVFIGNSWADKNVNADLYGYSSLRIKGTPKMECKVLFNGGLTNELEIKLRLDAIGYGEIDLTSIDGISANVKPYDGCGYDLETGHLYLSSIKKSETNTVANAELEYVRAVKDQNELAEGVHELVREDFHTWNGGVNATVTRRDANGTSFKAGEENDGFFQYDQYGQNTAQNYAELTGYKWMKFEGDPNTNIFVGYNAPTIGNSNSDPQKHYFSLDSNGEYWLDISNHQYFHLHNIARNGGTGKLNAVKLIPDPRVDYVLRGNGVLAEDAAKAMLDPTACVIDARTRVNNKQVIDLYTEQVYDANNAVWNIAKWIGLSDNTLVLEPQGYDPNRARYIRMANQNCIVMVRGDFDSTKDEIGYGDITNIQYWHGIRSMHHANMAIIPADYDGTTDHKVMTAGLFLVDGFPYRIPMQLRITQGNSGSYARVNNKSAENKALVNTICVPFTVTLASKSGDTNSIHANASTDRNALNGEETRCQFYKITDLVHNTTRETTTAGLLQQDVVKQGDYVFWFEPVTTLEPYHPYVFVNKYDGQLREGTRMEVYTGWAGAHNDVYPTVNPDGTMCQNMNNASDKTDLNGADKDDYYLRGTNAAKHIRDCWYFNTEGRLVKAKYMTNNTFRAVLKSDSRSINMPFENDPAAQIKVVHADWMNGADEEVVAVEAIDVTNDAMVSVYSVNGILLRPSVELGVALEGLPSGIYIVNGKKAIKK